MAPRKKAATAPAPTLPAKIDPEAMYSVRVLKPITRGTQRILPRHDAVQMRGTLVDEYRESVEVIEKVG